jgi:hypothetical protein
MAFRQKTQWPVNDLKALPIANVIMKIDDEALSQTVLSFLSASRGKPKGRGDGETSRFKKRRDGRRRRTDACEGAHWGEGEDQGDSEIGEEQNADEGARWERMRTKEIADNAKREERAQSEGRELLGVLKIFRDQITELEELLRAEKEISGAKRIYT